MEEGLDVKEHSLEGRCLLPLNRIVLNSIFLRSLLAQLLYILLFP